MKILGPLDGEPGAADRGNLIQDALDGFIRAGAPDAHDAALAARLEHGRRVCETVIERPAVGAGWWPRCERSAHWFIAAEAERDELRANNEALQLALREALGAKGELKA
mgnify:CR=1 FL=1